MAAAGLAAAEELAVVKAPVAVAMADSAAAAVKLVATADWAGWAAVLARCSSWWRRCTW